MRQRIKQDIDTRDPAESLKCLQYKKKTTKKQDKNNVQ